MGRVYFNTEGVITDGRNIEFVYTPVIGDNIFGGIVISASTMGGLIAMDGNLGSAQWGCFSTVINTTGSDGYTNTINILNGCSTPNIAADKCWDSTYNSYTDWYLPSKFELDTYVMPNWEILNMIDGFYWSSTAYDGNSAIEAWGATLTSGSISYYYPQKDVSGLVRAIRKYTLY